MPFTERGSSSDAIDKKACASVSAPVRVFSSAPSVNVTRLPQGGVTRACLPLFSREIASAPSERQGQSRRRARCGVDDNPVPRSLITDAGGNVVVTSKLWLIFVEELPANARQWRSGARPALLLALND